MCRTVAILIIFLFFGCTHLDDSINAAKSSPDSELQGEAIILQPLSSFPDEHIQMIEARLKSHGQKVIIQDPVPMPEFAYYPKRNRYRADSLIKYLWRITPEGHVTVGLTTKDISHTKGKIKDYGIMGLGLMPGKSCVVSSYRLAKKNLREQLYKLTVHELGHTRGLPHCEQNTCFMRDCKGKNHWDEETGFCDKCEAFLVSKGWKFKE